MSYYEWKWSIWLHFFVNMTSHQRRKPNLLLHLFTRCPHFRADPQSAIYITNLEAAGQELLRMKMVDLASHFFVNMTSHHRPFVERFGDLRVC